MNNNFFKKMKLKHVFLLALLVCNISMVDAAGFGNHSNVKSFDERLEEVEKIKADNLRKLEKELQENTDHTKELKLEIKKIRTQLALADEELDIINSSLVKAKDGAKECIKDKNIELARIKKEKKDYLKDMPNNHDRVIKLYNNNLKKLKKTTEECIDKQAFSISDLGKLESKVKGIIDDIKLSDNNLGNLEAQRNRLLKEAKRIQTMIDTLRSKKDNI